MVADLVAKCIVRVWVSRCAVHRQRPGIPWRMLSHWCHENRVVIDYIEPGKPNQNAYIGWLNRGYRTEALDAWLFRDLDEVCEFTWASMLEYNEARDHDSFEGMTPIEALENTKVSTFGLSV